jgi:hypothetical protein
MSQTNIWAMKIFLKGRFAARPELGLYTPTEGNSQIRLSEAQMLNTTESYSYDNFLLDGWCQDITLRDEAIRVGGIAVWDPVRIAVQNVNNFSLRCDELGVTISGCEVKIIEFVGTDSDSDSVATNVKFTGRIDSVDGWGESQMSFSAHHASKGRRAFIGTKIGPQNYPEADQSVGKLVPLTFGTLRQARHLRVEDKQTRWATAATQTMNIVSGEITLEIAEPDDIGLSCFPIVGNPNSSSPPTGYNIRVCASTPVWKKSGLALGPGNQPYSLDQLVGKFLRVVGGNASNAQMREIEFAILDLSLTGPSVVQVFVKDYFPETLIGNPTATANGNSWVEIIDIKSSFATDVWPCRGFLDSNGTPISQAAELYAFDDTAAKYRRIPPYGYDVDTSSDNNALEIDPKLFDTSPDTIASFLVLPAQVKEYDKPTLSSWGYANYMRKTDGFFQMQIGEPSVMVKSGDLSNIFDKNKSTRRSITLYHNYLTGKYVLSFPPPALEPGYEFDKIFLIITAEMGHGDVVVDMAFEMRYRRFFGSSNQLLSWSYDVTNVYPPPVWYLDSAPDFYFNSDPNTKNRNFFVNRNMAASGNDRYLCGYRTFELTAVSNRDIYNSIKEFSLIFDAVGNGDDFTVHVYEVALAFQKTTDIRSEVFGPFSGRIRNAAWRDGKAATDLLETPVDIVESIRRLQNFDGTNTPGRAYDPNASINIGSFDHSSLSAAGGTDVRLWTPGDIRLARQIESEADAYTDTATQQFCEDSFLLSYQNNAGEECVDYLFREGTPVATITPDNMIEVGDFVPPKPKDIFCLPVVKYAYDPGSDRFLGEYDSELGRHLGDLRIMSCHDDMYDPSYTEGFKSNADALMIYQMCNKLWRRYGVMEIMPDSLSERRSIVTYDVALWWLYNFLRLSDRMRSTVTIPYEVGRSWVYGDLVNLQLPHQTNDTVVRCKIHGITYARPRMAINVVLLDEIDPNFYDAPTWFQDGGSLPSGVNTKWQDNDLLYADRGNTGIPDSQDSD